MKMEDLSLECKYSVVLSEGSEDSLLCRERAPYTYMPVPYEAQINCINLRVVCLCSSVLLIRNCLLHKYIVAFPVRPID